MFEFVLFDFLELGSSLLSGVYRHFSQELAQMFGRALLDCLERFPHLLRAETLLAVLVNHQL